MNRPQTLRQTLESYMAADYLPAQIIVVDQSQAKDVQRHNKRLLEDACAKTETIYIYQQEPSSTKARNNALQVATQDILVWSDDDVDVYKDTLKNVYDLFQNPQIALIAGINDRVSPSTSHIGYLLGTKSFLKRNIGHVTGSMLGRYPNKVIGEVPTQWAMGYFFAVRTPLLKKWGIEWDEHLSSYAYAEDLDFSYSYYKHAKVENLRCVLSDKVHVIHRFSQEYRTPSKKTTYMYVCNRYYLAHKHKMRCGKLALLWSNLCMLLFRTIKRQAPKDMLNALIYCAKNKDKIKQGMLELE